MPVLHGVWQFRRRPEIFETIPDRRSVKLRFWSLVASLCLNTIVLTALIAAFEVAAVRRSSDRLLAAMQKELGQYRMVLLLPRTREVSPPPKPVPVGPRRPRRLRPLAVPDLRLLRHMDPALVDFVEENPEIESIVTREIVRDIDSKTLSFERLLQRSSILVRFGLDEAGHLVDQRVEKSSGVPSIDHLALELVKLLEKYQILGVAIGTRSVSVSIDIDRQIIVEIQGDVMEPADLEKICKQVQNELTLMRFLLANNEMAFLLKDISLSRKDNSVVVSKTFDKEALIAFLMRYYRPEPQE